MRISCLQMNMRAEEPDQNFAHAEALVRQAVTEEQPDVLLLPETWNTGFWPDHIGIESADTDCLRTRAMFSSLAREYSVNILAGSVMNNRNGALYNTALAFDRDGALVGSYDKTHLFSPMGEDRCFQKGDHLTRFSFDGVSCGVIICYDLRFPELIRALALPGLDVLFIVSQWPYARLNHLSILTRARAIENQIFAVLCNSCGKAGDTQYGGHSALVDPYGNILTQAQETETILTGELDLNILAAIRSSIPVFADRRPELYQY